MQNDIRYPVQIIIAISFFFFAVLICPAISGLSRSVPTNPVSKIMGGVGKVDNNPAHKIETRVEPSARTLAITFF